MREFVGNSGKLGKIVDRKGDRTAVEAFYASRDYEPLWVGMNGATDRARQAINHLRNADADGMDPADYPVPAIAADGGAAALAEAEIRLTESALDYARHAQVGRVHYSRVSGDITYNQVAPDSLDVLSKLANGKDAAAALDTYQPPHPQYKALRKKLAEVRGHKGDKGPEKIAGGSVLKLVTDKKGKTVLMQDERVPALRARLNLEPVKDDLFYDKPLADAVAAYQKGKGLPANGQLTNATLDALNGKRHDRDDQIIMANMERWRWVPRDLGKAHVILNIPDFTLRVYNNGATVWRTKVVVGKLATPTPLLSETMKYITVNPTWNVPPSIVYNEYLPALQQDPTVLKRMGLNLAQRPDGSVHISQPPGEKNALGRIRFNFPNKFLVYQHDTPDKHLFAHDRRAYSHGCMRVEDPAKYAAGHHLARDAGDALQRRKDQEHVRPLRDRPALHHPDLGAHHLPDGVRGRRGQVADPRRPLRPRSAPSGGAEERGPPDGRDPGRTVPAELQPAFSPAAERRWKRLEQRPILLRPALWQPNPAGAAAAGRSAPREPRDHPVSTEKRGCPPPGRPLSTCC